MKNKNSDFMIVLFSIIAIVSLSISFSIEESFSVGDLDRDKDGILDEDDQCPQISETYNKFEDLDGCPDSVTEEKTEFEFPDSDGDGYEDRTDSCVFLPETWNGYLDFDGCPEIIPNQSESSKDSDSDSIPDSIDACPLEKESFNEFKDGDGCPDFLIPESVRSTDSSFTDNQCLDGKILVIRINSENPICVYLDIAKRWEQLGIAEIVTPLVIEDTIKSGEYQEEIISKTAPEIAFPEHSDQTEIPAELLASETASSFTILDTGKTVIGQDISYPSGLPKIISKIVTIPVGAETGTHIHEYPMFAYVLEGEIMVDYGDEGIKTFAKGDSLIEAINFDHNGKNLGNEPAEILVVLMGEN